MSYIKQSYTKSTEVNSQLQMKCKEIDKLQEGKEMLIQDSSQLEAINKRLEAHNEKSKVAEQQETQRSIKVQEVRSNIFS